MKISAITVLIAVAEAKWLWISDDKQPNGMAKREADGPKYPNERYLQDYSYGCSGPTEENTNEDGLGGYCWRQCWSNYKSACIVGTYLADYSGYSRVPMRCQKDSDCEAGAVRLHYRFNPDPSQPSGNIKLWGAKSVCYGPATATKNKKYEYANTECKFTPNHNDF